MTKFRSFLLAGAAVLGVGPVAVPARAQDVTPAQQAVLEAQLKALYSLGGLIAPTGPAPWSVVPAGDHFAVAAPLHLSGPARGDLQVTGNAKPGENGRWSWTALKTTTPFQMQVDLPVPPKDGEKGPPKTRTVTYTANVGAQDGTAEFDPSFATVSSWANSFRDMVVQASSAGLEQTTTIATSDSKMTLTPVDGGKVDLVMNGSLTGYKLDSKASDDTPAILATMDKVTVTGGIAGINRAQAARMAGAMKDLFAFVGQAPAKGPANLPRPLLAELIAATQDFASSMTIAETFDNLAMNIAGMDIGLNQVQLGLDWKAEGGLLRNAMDLGYQGLKLPPLGLGELEALVPQKVFARPYVSGVSAADMGKLLTALNENRDPSPAEIAAVFSHGGVVTGLETMTLDLGGTAFSADGKLTFSSPTAMAGTARVVADNFDALVQKLSEVPMAQQIMPAVIFLKGIGKADGGKLVWTINYGGSKLLVNNIDLSAMAGAGPTPAGPSHPPAATPNEGAPKRPAPRPQGQQNRNR